MTNQTPHNKRLEPEKRAQPQAVLRQYSLGLLSHLTNPIRKAQFGLHPGRGSDQQTVGCPLNPCFVHVVAPTAADRIARGVERGARILLRHI
jgi:hypothetical protein